MTPWSGSGASSACDKGDSATRSGNAPGSLRMSVQLSREAYAGHYGPTSGDRIRLADTELVIEVEKDFAVYGEEVQFGGGKVIRDSQGQSPLPPPVAEPPLDLVITNAVVLDHWGIVKGDIGVR